MNDHASWMNSETLQNYERWHNGCGKGDRQKAHSLRRSAFSAYLFQIIGNTHVLLWCIQHPICSDAQPADELRRLMTAWEEKGDHIQSAVLHSLQKQHGGSSTPSSRRRKMSRRMQIPERRSLKRKATEEEEEKGDDIQSAVLHSLQTQHGGSSTPSSRRRKMPRSTTRPN